VFSCCVVGGFGQIVGYCFFQVVVCFLGASFFLSVQLHPPGGAMQETWFRSKEQEQHPSFLFFSDRFCAVILLCIVLRSEGQQQHQQQQQQLAPGFLFEGFSSSSLHDC
jgi:glycerol uptake facilitator-like aquaporin